MRKSFLYAVYDGDTFIAIGNKYELAEMLGVKPETVAFWATPTSRKRNPNGRMAVKIPNESE